MKALLLSATRTLEFVDFPEPAPREEEIRVLVKACGICGSDVKGYQGKTNRRIPPVVMGHEATGVVDEVGAKAKDVKKGEHVALDSLVNCRKCPQCFSGRINLCEGRKVLGVSIPGMRVQGAMAEKVCVPWWVAYPMPERLDFTQGALLEPAAVALHAVK